MSEPSYNPLDKINLGKSVAEALLARPAQSLGGLDVFDGAGIYVIYYRGGFAPYEPMARRNVERVVWPIYVGKAIPSGGRKGGDLFRTITGPYLFNRLREHADSIRAAENLDVNNFECRYLIVDDIWIPLGETLLIGRFKPLWNLALDGFGNHDPGSGRYNGLRPFWDILHPGRKWSLKLRDRDVSGADIADRVKVFLAENQPPSDPHMKFDPPSSIS